MSSWRGINLPNPQLHDYRHMLICHKLHLFGGINIQHNNYKEKLHTHGCILQLFDSEWQRRPNTGAITNISVKLCIQAAFYFPFIHLHTVGPSFKSGACFLVVQIAQAAITLAITINILWGFNLGRELEEQLFKASATWDSDVGGDQHTPEEDCGGLFELYILTSLDF